MCVFCCQSDCGFLVSWLRAHTLGAVGGREGEGIFNLGKRGVPLQTRSFSCESLLCQSQLRTRVGRVVRSAIKRLWWISDSGDMKVPQLVVETFVGILHAECVENRSGP